MLEQLLQDYTGTLFLVSHDRTFLDNVVTQTISSEGEGRWREQVGGYADWAEWRARAMAARVSATKASEKSPDKLVTKSVADTPAKSDKKADKKLSWKENQELEALPG